LSVVSVEHLLKDIQHGERAYVLHPGNLVCSTLSDDIRNTIQTELRRGAVGATPPPTGPSGDAVLDAAWYDC
jgi:hypothetical protein